MAKVYEFLADGFEEIEALTPVDVLRRGGVETLTVSIMGRREVHSAHGVTVLADLTIEEAAGNFDDADMLLLPGGMPGSTNLRDCEGVIAALQRQDKAGKRIGAICAAPLVLAHAGLLHGRKATIYPGMDAHLGDATYEERLVVEDGNIITACGPAAVLPYSYKILSYFRGEEAAQSVAKGMVFDRLLREA